MTIFNYRLPVSQALAIAADIDAGIGLIDIHNVVPTAPAVEDTLRAVADSALNNSSDIYIISLVTDGSNQIMEPYVADISEAFENSPLGLNNLYFRYVAL